MQFLLSPWFIGLSIISVFVMGLELWGLMRSCRKHNASPIGVLCGREKCFPTTGIIVAALLYILLTFGYIIAPAILHDLI